MPTLRQKVLSVHKERPSFKYAEVLGDGIIAAVEEHKGFLATVVYYDPNLWYSKEQIIAPEYLRDTGLGVASAHLKPADAIRLARERLFYKHPEAIWFDEEESEPEYVN